MKEPKSRTMGTMGAQYDSSIQAAEDGCAASHLFLLYATNGLFPIGLKTVPIRPTRNLVSVSFLHGLRPY